MTLNDFERTHVPPHLHALAARARAALQRFTTFPDTTLRLELGGGSSGFVVASITTRNADAPERAVAAQKAAWFDLQELAPDPTPQLAALAREALVRLLTHEVDEWLRLDGAPLRRPHDGPAHRLHVHLPQQAPRPLDAGR